jgi:hypothetical protein
MPDDAVTLAGVKRSIERSLLVAAALIAGYVGGSWAARAKTPAQEQPTKLAGGVSDKVPPGYRAVVVPVSCSEAELVRSGDRVDVVATFDRSDSSSIKEARAETFLQNVLALAVQAPRSDQNCGAVVLALNPYESQFAFLAMDRKKIHVSIRPRGDVEIRPMEIISFRKLFR